MADQETLNRFVIGIQVKDDGSLEKLLNAIKKINKATKDQAKAQGEASRSAKDVGASINNINDVFANTEKRINSFNKVLRRGFRSTKNDISDVLRRVTLWGSSISLIFGTLGKIKSIYNTIIDLQVQMAELQKVMGDYKPYDKLKATLFELSKAYSINIMEATEIAKIWAQQGKTMDEVVKLTEIAIRGMNSANLTAAQSVEFLTSVTQTYNMEAEKTYAVLDGIMKVQASNAITAQNLAKAFMIAGKAASVLGDDMGTLMGLFTVIGEKTRETGNVIGNSVKTMIARLDRPRTKALLEQYGIKTRGERGFTNFRMIMQQINALIRAGKISPDQQREIAKEIGGVRKYKDVLIAMLDWEKAEKVRLQFLKAYGDAARASAIVQDTLARKLEKFNTALVELGDTVLNQNVIPAFTQLTGVLTGMVEGLNELSKGEYSKYTLDIMSLMPLVMLGSAFKNKVAIGRITDMMREIETAVALRKSGMMEGYYSPYEKAFGLIDIVNKKGKKTVIEHAKIYDEFLNNAKEIEKNAVRFGTEAHYIMRNALAQLLVSVNEKRGKGVGFWSMFMRGFGAGTAMSFGGSGGMSTSATRGIRGAAAGIAIAQFVTNLAKFTAITVGIEAVLRLINNLLSKKKGKEDLTGTIDFTSDISKDFISITEKIKEFSDAAKSYGLSVDEYIEKVYGQEEAYKYLIDKIAKPISDLIDNKTIKTLEDLRDAFRKLGVDVKNYNEALNIQMVMYKFISNELLKERKNLLDYYQKKKEEFLPEINKQIIDNLFNETFRFIEKGQGVSFRQISAWYRLLNKKLEYSLTTKIDKHGNEVADKYIIKSDISKLIEERYGSGAVEFIKKQAKQEKDFWEAYNEAIETKNKEAKKMLDDFIRKSIKDFLIKKLPLAKLDIAEPSLEKYGGDKKLFAKKVIEKEYDNAVNELVNNIVVTSESFKEMKKVMQNLDKNLNNKLQNSVIVLSEFIKSLLTAKDYVFNALVDFGNKLKSIEIDRDLSKFLGVRKNYNQQILESVRSFFIDIAKIPINLESAQLKAEYNFERLNKILSTKNLIENYGMREQVKDLMKDISGEKDIKVKLSSLEDLLDLLETISNMAERTSENASAVRIMNRIISELSKVYAELEINMGKMIRGTAQFEKALQRINPALNISENDLRNVVQAYYDGNIKKANQILSKYGIEISDLINAAAREIFINIISDIELNYINQTNELRSKVAEIFGSGDIFADIEKIGKQRISNIVRSYNAQIELLKQKTEQNAEDIIVQTKRLEIERDLSVQIEKTNTILAIYEEQMNRLKNVLESVKNSTVSFLSSLQTYDFSKSSGFMESLSNYLSGLGQSYLENVFGRAFDEIVGGKGLGLAAVLAGEKKPDEPNIASEINEYVQDIRNLRQSNNNLEQVNTALVYAIDNLNKNLSVITGQTISDASKLLPQTTFSKQGVKYEDMDRNATIYSQMSKQEISDAQKMAKFSKAYYITRSIGAMSGMALGAWLAQKNNKTGEMASFGSMMGGALSTLVFGGNPFFALTLPLIGGMLGGLFGGKNKEDKLSSQLDELNKNTEKIIENTAPLKEIDDRIINAPSNFILPALAKSGGNIQNIGSVVININGANDPKAIANEISNLFDGNFGFDNVHSNI